MISAHWYVNLSAVTAMDRPKTIHDFYGFPDELFSVRYPAPGDLALAEEVAEIAKPTWVGFDHGGWGLDHWGQPDSGFDWAQRFDDAARSHMTSSPQDLAALRGHMDFGASVPTPDHFIPFLYIAGLASAAGSMADVLVDGYTYGSLSMTSYTIDANWPEEEHSGGAAAALPDPDLVPPDDTNT